MSVKKEPNILQGFKAFLMRGNVVDLAVAVVIGAAFTNIVNAVVKGIINPLVGAIGTQNLDNYSSCLSTSCKGTHGIQLMWGSVLGAALTFLITATVVYFLMVLPMSKYLARQEGPQEGARGHAGGHRGDRAGGPQADSRRDGRAARIGTRPALTALPRAAQSLRAGGSLRTAQRWWGGFSSRKRLRSAALSPSGRSPHPWSVSSEDCRLSGSSKISAGFGSRGSGAGAVLMPQGYGPGPKAKRCLPTWGFSGPVVPRALVNAFTRYCGGFLLS